MEESEWEVWKMMRRGGEDGGERVAKIKGRGPEK